MFINNIDPVAFEILGLQIRYYGLVYLIGFLFSYYLIKKLSRKMKFPVGKIDDYIFYVMVFSILGARIFEVLVWSPGYYLSNPIEIIKIWKGGLSFHGGLLGGVVYSYFFCKKEQINFYKLADLLMLPLSFFLFLGRIANYINSELVGKITDSSLGVNFNNETSNGELVYRHAYQLYASLKNLTVFVILLPLYLFKKLKPGVVFYSFVFLYALGRFIIDFYKEETLYFNLGVGQWLNLIMIIISIYWLWKVKAWKTIR